MGIDERILFVAVALPAGLTNAFVVAFAVIAQFHLSVLAADMIVSPAESEPERAFKLGSRRKLSPRPFFDCYTLISRCGSTRT
jgi:hypothetical protein